MSKSGVFGIDCAIGSPRVRRAIESVFAAVRRHPSDWARLRRRLRAIRYLSPGEDRDGTVGQWRHDDAEVGRLHAEQTAAFEAGKRGKLLRLPMDPAFHAAGTIFLARSLARLPWRQLVAVVAHECGHAVTRESEFSRRGGVSSEWASELCADRHAFRWGFERAIRAHAPHRRIAHHAALPGETIWEGDAAFRVDRRFFVRRCPRLDGRYPKAAVGRR